MTNSKRKQPTKPNATDANIEDNKSTAVVDEPPKSSPELAATTSTPTAQFFKLCFGHELHNFANLKSFSSWLQRPVDGAALGVFRMLYGAAMLIDIAEERGGGQLDVRFGEPHHCHFPLFNGINALAYPLMGCVYLAMWLGAIGIMLGYRFRCSCLTFVTSYWYIFLLDKPAWNNHSYLFGLVGTLLLFTSANSYWWVFFIYINLYRIAKPYLSFSDLSARWTVGCIQSYAERCPIGITFSSSFSSLCSTCTLA